MSDITSLLAQAQQRGLAVVVDGGKVKVRASRPPDTETRALIDQLRQHKEEIAKSLMMDAPPCWNCGAIMTETTDIYGEEVWVCWACAKWA